MDTIVVAIARNHLMPAVHLLDHLLLADQRKIEALLDRKANFLPPPHLDLSQARLYRNIT